ncbi:MAG: hypothetical protein ACYC7D_02010 [Nitrososphaerales archaeon]
MTRKLALNTWFRLPRVGTDSFADLMKAKVKYDTKFGFMLTSSTNLDRAFSTLSSALGEDVELSSTCFICNAPLIEEEGKSERTICLPCEEKEGALDLYRMKFAKLMENL